MFDTTERFIAFTPQRLAEGESLAAQYGADCEGVKTLIRWRDNDLGAWRPARLNVDFSPIALTDGRLVGLGYWSQAALDALPTLEGAEEITAEQFNQLKPQAEL